MQNKRKLILNYEPMEDFKFKNSYLLVPILYMFGVAFLETKIVSKVIIDLL